MDEHQVVVVVSDELGRGGSGSVSLATLRERSRLAISEPHSARGSARDVSLCDAHHHACWACSNYACFTPSHIYHHAAAKVPPDRRHLRFFQGVFGRGEVRQGPRTLERCSIDGGQHGCFSLRM